MIKDYYNLTKPGIIYGNAFTAAAGFFLAAQGHINVVLFSAFLVGESFVIASACVFNNYLDQDIDAKMARTRNRALVRKAILGNHAIIYATILGVAGFSLLAFYTNHVTVLIGLVGFIDYVVIYGITKRTTVQGTIIGSISGAVPPMAGYCAVTGRIDTAAILLFLMLLFWQMPHFYAIGIYRLHDYAAAKIPILPVEKGAYDTKVHIVLYAVGFFISSALLTAYRYTGYSYLIIMGGVGLYWIWLCLKGFRTKNNIQWARKVFLFSLVINVVLCFLLLANVALP